MNKIDLNGGPNGPGRLPMKCDVCGNRWAGPGVCPLHPIVTVRDWPGLDGMSERAIGEDAQAQRRRDRLIHDAVQEAVDPQNPNRLAPRERYRRDPMFHALVDMLRSAIARADYTPTEVREAAMLACIIEEQNRPARPIYLDDTGRYR